MAGAITLEGLGLPETLALAAVDASIRPATPPAQASLEGELEVLGTLGEGGMGVVLRAREPALDREVAVKRVKPGAPPDAGARLVEEARVVGSLAHPAIVPVHALRAGPDGQPELVMKRVEGESWREVARRGDRDVRFHVETAIALTHALDLAHARGILHRDIKPANVMLGAFGETYLLDWGVAARLGDPPSGLAGTPAYMAPEMILKTELSPRTDVYLLGGSLFEALTGAPPHPGAAFLDIARHALEGPPLSLPEALPRELEAILRRATERAPERRFATATALREALQAFLSHASSVELAEASASRAAEVIDGGPDPEALRLAFAEARFGLRQALRIWPENARAQALLRDAARAMVDLELAREDAEAAEALLAEHAIEDPSIRGRIDALHERRRQDARRREALERAAHDRDLRVGARRRLWFLAVYGAVSLGATVVGHLFFRAPLSYPSLMIQQLVLAATGAALMVAVLGWRPPNRRALEYRLALGAIVASLVGFTAVGWRLAMPLDDLVFFETAGLLPPLVLIAIGLDARAWIAALAVATGVALGLLAPSWRYAAVQLAQIGGLVALLLVWATRPSEPPEGSLDEDRRARGELERGAPRAGLARDEADAVEPRRHE